MNPHADRPATIGHGTRVAAILRLSLLTLLLLIESLIDLVVLESEY